MMFALLALGALVVMQRRKPKTTTSNFAPATGGNVISHPGAIRSQGA